MTKTNITQTLRITVFAILCGAAIYVLTFIVITRWSLPVEDIAGLTWEENVCRLYYFVPPFNSVEIVNSPRLGHVHYFLDRVFHPLAFCDYHLTGCYVGNLPLVIP
jgi:hypothetical protein